MATLPPEIVTTVLSEFIKCGTDYLACREREQTKRERIAAELEAKLALINANYDLCSKILADNHEYAMKSYDIAENLLNNPKVMEDAALLNNILTFIANTHSKVSDNLTTMFSNVSLGRLR